MNSILITTAQDYLIRNISDGRWKEGQVVPPVEDIAAASQTSPHAVRRAFRKLHDRGILKSVKKRGTTVLRRPALGRALFMTSHDAHTNLLLQDAVNRALVGADLDVEFQPYLFDDQTGFERLRQLAARDCHDAVLVTLAQETVSDTIRPEWEKFAAGFRYRVGFQFEDMLHLPNSVTVLPDPLRATRLVADHVLALGHRRIGVVAGLREADGSASERHAAALAEMLILVGCEGFAYQYSQNSEEGPAAFARRHGCTAWWAINDHQALDHIIQFQRDGLRVPEDISVIGSNDTPWAANPGLPLTTLSLDPAAIARAIAEAAEAVFTGGAAALKPKRYIPPVLVQRASTVSRSHEVTESEKKEQRDEDEATSWNEPTGDTAGRVRCGQLRWCGDHKHVDRQRQSRQ